MQVKQAGRWLPFFIIAVFAIGWKSTLNHASAASAQTAKLDGPAVILFRGDNDPNARAIDHIVTQAEARHGKQIDFVQLSESAHSPLAERYKVRSRPTVVIVDGHDRAVRRISGESPAAQKRLGHALARVATLVRQ